MAKASKVPASIFYSNSIPARINRKLSLLQHSFYLDNGADSSKTIFLCGAGRSGTTWLADVLNYGNEYRILYEPFNREQVSLCRHFSARQYLRPYDDDPRYLEPARAIFNGKVRNAWIDQENRVIFTRRRLVKDVRSTMMVKWVREHFPEMPIVFLVRHPCAVALSRVKLGWRTNLRDVFFSQDELMADHLQPFAELIRSAQSPFERHIVDWCVENFVPFAQLSKGDVYFVFYENLCSSPRAELQKLFSFLNRPFHEVVLKNLHTPSKTSYKKKSSTAFLMRENLINSWRKRLTSDELRAANRITRAFGLDVIYGGGDSAETTNVEALLKGARTHEPFLSIANS